MEEYVVGDSFEIENFLSDQEIADIRQRILDTHYDKTELIDKGVWNGKHVTTQYWAPEDQLDDILKEIKEKFDKLFDHDWDFEMGIILQSHYPYDVHNDYHIIRNHVDTEQTGTSFRTMIIPTHECDAQTVVFNESAESNHFYKYKESAEKAETPIDQNTWNELCNHCWEDDREYLTLHRVHKWKKGKLISFDRRRFHCSNNFKSYLDMKEAIIMFLRKK